jgi:hypothetical protein
LYSKEIFAIEIFFMDFPFKGRKRTAVSYKFSGLIGSAEILFHIIVIAIVEIVSTAALTNFFGG